MRFELKAVREDGAVEDLDFQAADRDDAIRQARDRGYTVLSVHGRRALTQSLRFTREAYPLMLFSQELLVLLRAGLPLVPSLETLAQKESKAEARSIIERLCVLLREGKTFSTALQQFPGTFPPLYIATIRASERTGDIAPSLARFVAYRAQLDTVRKKLVNASIYPALLLCVGGLVSMFLLLYVVPRFSKIYEERAGDLPLLSRLLLSWGQAIEAQGPLVLSVLVVVVFAAIYALTRSPVRKWMLRKLWGAPVIGERIRIYQLARFYRTLGMLLGSGIPIVTAITMAADLLDPTLRARLDRAAVAIGAGLPISRAMDEQGLTTPVAQRLLGVGEQAGNMGEMMERIAEFHDEEIARWVDWFSRLFEPLLMTLIGLVIGVIVVLMYLPIFELANSIE